MTAATLAALFAATTHAFSLPSGLLSSVCFVESHHDVAAIVANDGGSSSVGVCQMKLATAKMLGFQGTLEQLKAPKMNVKYAGKYLRYQLNRYDGDTIKAIAAYNAGTHMLNRKGLPVNHRYVQAVLAAWEDTSEQ